MTPLPRFLTVAAVAAGLLSDFVLAKPLATAAGLVYEDANGNGVRDPGEPGIAGVPVTEGVGFAETDSDGRFQLPLRPDPVKRHGEPHVVSIATPRSYVPAGPWFRVPGAGGKSELRFALRKRETPLPFTWIHGTDPHVPRAGRPWFEAFRRDVAARGADVQFCVLTGDLVDLSDAHPPRQARAEFDILREQTADFPVPLRVIPGNHDLAGVRGLKNGWTPETDGYGYNFYTRTAGPLRWSFNVADVHFVGLDFNTWTGKNWEWGAPPSAVAWLAKDLARAPKGSRVGLFVHHYSNSKSLEAFLKEHPVDWIFVGHGHKVREESWLGIPVFESGSITRQGKAKTPPPGYRVVEIREDGIRTEYVATRTGPPS